MKTLHRMLLSSFILVFFFAMLFFILILQIVDIFANIWNYIDKEIPFVEILRVALFYIPKCISYAIPVAMLFSISFIMGTMYMNNELIAILGSGVSIYWLVMPLIICGVLFSIGAFFFEDKVVIDTYKAKNELVNILIKKKPESYSRENISILNNEKDLVYRVQRYDDEAKILKGVQVYKYRSQDLVSLFAERASWNGKNWILHNCRIYKWNNSRTSMLVEEVSTYNAQELTEEPKTFRKPLKQMEELDFQSAGEWIETLKTAGIPHTDALTDYYKKISFAVRSLIVTLIACSIGGAFKKNILLMSLLTVLVISVVYFVFEMVTSSLAKNGYIPPLAGAWIPFLVFLLIGGWMFKQAKT